MKVTVTLELNLDVDGWASWNGHGTTAIGLTEAMREGLRALGSVDNWAMAQACEPTLGGRMVEVKSAKATGHF